VARQSAGRAWLIVALTLVAVAVGALVAVKDVGPYYFGDETVYLRNAEALATFSWYADAHYPPFYPLLISLGLHTADWYLAMLLINTAISATTVPIMWFLAGSLGLRHQWIPTALAALLPFQAVFSGFLLSENASVPLVLLCTALAVRGRRREAPWFGLALAALHLTKYLFAPAVVLFLLVWALRLRAESATTGGTNRVGRARPVVVVCLAYVVPMALWLAYGLGSGERLPRLLGLHVVSDTASRGANHGTLNALLTWTTAYPAYVLLASLGAWVLIAIGTAHLRPRFDLRRGLSVRQALTVTAALLAVGYIAIGIEHSFGAEYNFPVPDRLLSRYMIHLAPVLLALAAMVLERLIDLGHPLRGWRIWLPSTLTLAGGWIAWWILYRGGVWGLRPWSLRRPFNAVDTFVLEPPAVLAGFTVTYLVMVWLLRYRRAAVAAVPWILTSTAGLVLATYSVMTTAPIPGLRVNQVASYAIGVADASDDHVLVWVPEQDFQAITLRRTIDFWRPDLDDQIWAATLGAEKTPLAIHCLVPPAGDNTEFLFSGTLHEVEPALASGSGPDGVLVYALEPGCLATALLEDAG